MAGAMLYERLMSAGRPALPTFDCHVVACILAIAADETAATGRSICEGVGLGGGDLKALLTLAFPGAVAWMDGFDARLAAPDEEEAMLGRLLMAHATDNSTFQRMLAVMLARRAMRPNHLWQDLGLGNRDQLSGLMNRHFAGLARRNAADMKWKKFLYRVICRDEGFGMCAAPSCAECDDFAICFGDESGESLLARVRLAGDRSPQKEAAPSV